MERRIYKRSRRQKSLATLFNQVEEEKKFQYSEVNKNKFCLLSRKQSKDTRKSEGDISDENSM